MPGWYHATKGRYGLEGYYTPQTLTSKSILGWLRQREGVHGNSLASPRMAYVYGLYTDSGNLLKIGLSQNPLKRYPKWYMDRLEIEIIKGGPRAEMAPLERYFIETGPGPLNNEPWAGRQVPQ